MNHTYDNQLVSVIMPVYNSEKHLKEALNSIFKQSYKNIEIVIVDDKSTDCSAKIIMKIQEKHPEIIYYLKKKNMGAGVARNKALKLAKGRYVAFLDSDDIWQCDKIERQLKLMKEKHVGFTYTAIKMIDDGNRVLKGKRNIPESCDYQYLLHNTIIATSSVLIDRNIIGDFQMSLRRSGQDYATWLRILRKGVMAYGINEALVNYRVTNQSLSSNKFKSIKQVWEIQTQDEKIGKISAAYHAICFGFHGLRKYFF